MPLTREKKSDALKELADLLAKSKTLLFTNFSSISVEKIKELRKGLYEGGASYKIAKKSLLNIALKEAGVSMGGMDFKGIEGSVGVVFAPAEQVAPTRATYLFSKAKENKDFTLLGGIFDNKLVDMERLSVLAKANSRDDLLGGLLRQFMAPVGSLVYALQAISETK